MAVIVFNYHRTPSGAAEDYYDVPLPAFREQIDMMVDAGVPFIRFQDIHENDYLQRGMHAVLTFDDGHVSNREAIEYVAGKGIVPSAFIVREWATQSRPDFFDSPTITQLSSICDFGGHGATHTGLIELDDVELRDELTSSRAFLEDRIGRPVSIMALPGGAGDARVIRIALSCGFKLIGNSISTINRSKDASINRLAVIKANHARVPLELAMAGRLFWDVRNTRIATINAMRAVLGDSHYRSVSQAIKRLGAR